jgi:Tol biopolymer transport system component
MKWLGAVAVVVVLAATGSSPDGFNDTRRGFFSRPAPQVQVREPDSDPMWAPGGTFLAFRRQSAVLVVRASGGRARKLVRGGSIAWLPGGRIGVGLDLDVFVMSADGSRRRRVARGEVPVWSPDGRKVVISRYNANRDTTQLFVVDVRSRAQRAIPPPTCRCDFTDGEPAWSADGKRLVFTRFVDSPASQTSALHVTDADATHVRRLAPREVEGATWSPRGDRVAGSAWEGSDRVVRVVSVADGSVVKIGRGASPSWSPSGRQLAFRGRDGVFVARANGTSLRRLSGPRGPTCPAELSPCLRPSWSPDGHKVLWASGAAIVVSSADRGSSSTIANGTDAVWSPDGTRIAFAKPKCGAAQGVYVIRASGSEKRRLSRHCDIYGTQRRERIVGTPADDSILAWDRKRDRVKCEAGVDWVLADKIDQVGQCEGVSRR